MVEIKLNLRQQCILAVMENNNMLACISRSSAGSFREIIVTFCLVPVRGVCSSLSPVLPLVGLRTGHSLNEVVRSLQYMMHRERLREQVFGQSGKVEAESEVLYQPSTTPSGVTNKIKISSWSCHSHKVQQEKKMSP